MRQRLKDSLIQREVYQKELEQLQDQFKSIIDNMPAMLIGLNNDARVTQWNLQAQKETNIKMEKAIGKKLISLIPSLSDYMNIIDQSCKENRPIRKMEIQKQINGQPSFWDLMVYPLGSDGRSSVIRLENVTERVKINQMLIQSEKMVSVGGLAAGMAHEINNPLAGMVQNAQVVISRINKDLPDNDKIANELGTSMGTIRAFMEKRKILMHLQMIREAGDRVSKIVNNMLNFSRKKNLPKSPHHIAKLLDETLDLLENDFNVDKRNDFKQIVIQKEYEENLSPILCEANEIQQVFLNILKNSAEAMAGQKQPEIILRIFNSDRNTHIEIEDNGPGMDDSVRKRIFEPFFTTKPVDRGTGLGLSVSYMIITENHKGTIHVESKLKTGTKFIICLPQGI